MKEEELNAEHAECAEEKREEEERRKTNTLLLCVLCVLCVEILLPVAAKGLDALENLHTEKEP